MTVLTVLTATSAYTITVSDQAIIADTTTGSFTLTLPTAATAGRLFSIKKVDANSNVVTIATTGGQLIDGVSTLKLTEQFQSVALMSNGTGWEVR